MANRIEENGSWETLHDHEIQPETPDRWFDRVAMRVGEMKQALLKGPTDFTLSEWKQMHPLHQGFHLAAQALMNVKDAYDVAQDGLRQQLVTVGSRVLLTKEPETQFEGNGMDRRLAISALQGLTTDFQLDSQKGALSANFGPQNAVRVMESLEIITNYPGRKYDVVVTNLPDGNFRLSINRRSEDASGEPVVEIPDNLGSLLVDSRQNIQPKLLIGKNRIPVIDTLAQLGGVEGGRTGKELKFVVPALNWDKTGQVARILERLYPGEVIQNEHVFIVPNNKELRILPPLNQALLSARSDSERAQLERKASRLDPGPIDRRLAMQTLRNLTTPVEGSNENQVVLKVNDPRNLKQVRGLLYQIAGDRVTEHFGAGDHSFIVRKSSHA